ncbi:MAG: AsmA-like C-terminal region-containing protein [Marinifilaceae bacterium]
MLRRIIKWSFFTHLVVTIAVIIALLILIRWVLTPTRITPFIVKKANELVEARIDVRLADLTFFSTFPDLGVKVQGLTVINPIDSTLKQPQDTLLQVENCVAKINLPQLIIGRIIVKEFTLDNPTIYAYVSPLGVPNWDIVPLDTNAHGKTEIIVDTLEHIEHKKEREIKLELHNVVINKGNVTFDDRSTDLYTDFKDMNLALNGALFDKQARLGLDFNAENILIWQNGELLVKRLRFGIQSDVNVNRDSNEVKLNKAVFDVNGIRMGAGGTLRGIMDNKAVDVNLRYGIDIPSLHKILELVPPSILSKEHKVDVKGMVLLQGNINGVYGEGKFPIITADLSIENGQIAYDKMPVQVEKLDVKAHAFVDMNRQQPSNISVSEFIFKGGATSLSVLLNVDDVLNKPYLKSSIKGNINLTELTQIFPLQDSIVCKGSMVADLKAEATLKDIYNSNYGMIKANGSMGVKDIELYIPQEDVMIKWANAGISFAGNQKNTKVAQGRDLLNGIVGFSGLNIRYKDRLTLVMDTTFVKLSTTPLKDTNNIATVNTHVQLGKSEIIVKDTLLLGVDKITGEARLAPSPKNATMPVLTLNGSILRFRSQLLANMMNIEYASVNVALERQTKDNKSWRSNGKLQISNMEAFTPFFPLVMRMPGTSLTLAHNTIQLDSATVSVGDSDLCLTGSVRDLANWMYNDGTLNADFRITSDMLNCNQIIHAMGVGEEFRRQVEQGKEQNKLALNENAEVFSTLTDTLAYDSVSTLFVVPPRIDFTFQTDIKQAVFGKLYMDSIHGEVVMKNQSIELSNLKMRSSAANMETTLLYRASTSKEAYTGFSMNMYDIRIDSLVHLVPALDTLFPMLQSFEGVVNFQMAGEAYIDSTMNVVLPTLRGAAYMDGHDLVLMDGETFSEISKMLMFKNKQKNSIDSISVSMAIKNGTVEVFPFLVEIDRYQAAVGGKHNIDMSFNYHISILKSPLPFRAGVDVYGTMDKMKFRITKAKYKDMFIPSRKGNVDSTKLNVQQQIKQKLNQVTHTPQ